MAVAEYRMCTYLSPFPVPNERTREQAQAEIVTASQMSESVCLEITTKFRFRISYPMLYCRPRRLANPAKAKKMLKDRSKYRAQTRICRIAYLCLLSGCVIGNHLERLQKSSPRVS